jgi:hypothetical protein
MAKIDVETLVKRMAGAARGVLKKKWPKARDYAQNEFQKISQSIAFIERQHLAGKMTDEQARLHLEIQKNTARMVLLTLEGLGILTVESALNAALQVVRDTVNSALGFALI